MDAITNPIISPQLQGESFRHPPQCVHELLCQQMRGAAHKSAVQFSGKALTYSALDIHSAALAAQLRDSNRSEAIGVFVSPGLDLLTALAGILRAGHYYVPLDPNYPLERLRYIVKDAGIRRIVTNRSTLRAHGDALFDGGRTAVMLCNLQGAASDERDNYPAKSDPDGLAYLLYTSGSTGKPKGVAVRHRNLVNYAYWLRDYVGLTQSDVVDCSSTVAFDLTVSTSIVPLMFGATVVVCPSAVKADPHEYLRYLADNEVTLIKTTPSHLATLCHSIADRSLDHLRHVIVGGERLPAELIRKWLTRYRHHTVYNEYGPTEITVASSSRAYTVEDIADLERVSIGLPGYNMQYAIVDSRDAAPTMAAEGELWIAGAGVSAGYWNRPDLTEERYVRDAISGRTFYKTGDRVRWDGGQVLEYLGRMDRQIKIRGYRIELGEIENRLLSVPGVREAVVVPRMAQTNTALVAYYACNGPVSADAIKRALLTSLPRYMIPEYFVKVPHIPLTINGKADPGALPDPLSDAFDAADKRDLPVLKEQIATAWRQATGTTAASMDANFFDMGADSCGLASFQACLIDSGIRVDYLDLYEHVTVTSLAAFVHDHQQAVS